MRYYLPAYQGSRISSKTILVLTSIVLSIVLTHNASAITAQEVMDNVRVLYQDVENYAAVVYTYKADSMDVSESLFETQQPTVAFNLFFRKPDEHVVKEIGNSLTAYSESSC